jgi:hypothetical protein
MKTLILTILSITLLGCQNGSFNDPVSSESANRETSFKTCSELFTMPDGTINDTTNILQEYRYHGNLKDTSDIQPHEYLDTDGRPFNCPSGLHPAPYKWTWNVYRNESCNVPAVKKLNYGCPVYTIYIPIKFE